MSEFVYSEGIIGLKDCEQRQMYSASFERISQPQQILVFGLQIQYPINQWLYHLFLKAIEKDCFTKLHINKYKITTICQLSIYRLNDKLIKLSLYCKCKNYKSPRLSIIQPTYIINRLIDNLYSIKKSFPMQILQQSNFLTLLNSLPKQLNQPYHNLFRRPQNNKQSPLHLEKGIIINAHKGLGEFVEGEYLRKLKEESLSEYYKVKVIVVEVLNWLCGRFRLNTKFLKETNVKVQWNNNTKYNNSKKQQQLTDTPFAVYLIHQIYSTFSYLQPPQQQQHPSTLPYRQALCQLYYLLVTSNIIPISQLQLITQLLCGKYYDKQLSLQVIETSFRLIQAGIQQRNIFPYLYFVENSAINAIKVLYNNPKWIFSKGITIWTWFQANALLSETHNKEDCTLFMIKTDVGNALKIKLLKNFDIQVCSLSGGKEIQSSKISLIQHKIKLNEITMMGIEIQVLDGGFLKSSQYSLNIRINGSFYKETIISSQKMPKFTSNDLITDFILFDKFIGKVYSMIISNKSQLGAYQKLSTSFSNFGICDQAYVWSLVDSGILKKQNIVGIFNAERSFQGILINYVGQKNVACFSGLVSKQKYNKYDYQIIDVLMPYLYMLVVHHKTSLNPNQEQFEKLFDLMLKQIINIIASQEKEEDFIPSEEILFVLYFLELSGYSITQATLNYLLEEIRNAKNTANIYFELIGQFLDVPLMIHKGLTVPNMESNLQDMNPAKKTQILFLLQSKWQQKWTTQYQGFMSWWSPPFFSYQNDQPFDQKVFLYDQKKESRVEWQVRNFITNDLCKCILKPVFKLPEYAEIKRYQKEYVGKECFLEEFSLQLGNVKKGSRSVLRKYTASTLDRVKKRLLGSKQNKQNQHVPTQKTIILTKKNSIKSQISTQCLYIDLLTVIVSTITLSKQGFITITSKHSSKAFDHMCVKAFTNEYFMHVTFHFRDILFIRKRRFNQQMSTLQIRLKSGQIYLLYFYLKNVDQFISVLQEHVQVLSDPYSSYLQSHQPFKWIDKQMSNFQYIQWLNDVAGRNFLDIAQYPILPWVFVANQKQEKKQQKAYRDLMRNMGSHGPEQRIQHFMEKYASNNEQELFNEYHFGTHYSSSAIIFNYLIRVRPFSIGSMTLQSGKFDCADRIFGSYIGSWRNATNSPTDIRQLVPQIYTLPQMFVNLNNYDYGFTQDKLRIDNVDLPKWCQRDPYKFVAGMRRRLESGYVSENVNHWIDLIFGYKQRGKAAVEHMNIFFPLTYEDAINLDTVEDPQERVSFETQIAHFGQNPSQIIGNNPHPIRIKGKTSWEDKLFSDAGQGILIQRCNLDQKSKSKIQQKFLYKSIFQSKHSIMSIKFLDEFHFIVIRKHQYFIFKILQKKSQFISKQQQVSYDLQSTQIAINYQQLGHYVPTATIGNNLVALGGFFNGYVHFLFSQQSKCNQAVKFQGLNTVTAIEYAQSYQMLYMGDSEGYLKVFEISFGANIKNNTTNTKEIEFIQITLMKLHDQKITNICLNQKANLALTCSNDGFLKMLNLYSQQLIRVYRNPDFQFGSSNNSITFCQLSISPLYSVYFYSQKSHKIYSYSVNGQYLAAHLCLTHEKEHKSADPLPFLKDFIYNMAVVPTSDTTEVLTYLTSTKELFILELPFLELKRKIKLKKDTYKISCFESCQNGRICLTGTEDGGIQIVADPACY